MRVSSAALAAAVLSPTAFAEAEQIDAAWYNRSRRFASLPMCKVAYVEHGRGPVALFVHAYSLNGYQWRGALERLHKHRRCIAPDVMSMGYTETPEGQAISPETQAEMLAALLDSLHIDTVDLVANDSGGLLSQVFVAKYPRRVRTLLLTNCDVDTNNPPPQFASFVALAKNGVLVDRFIVPQLNDKNFARSPRGMGGLAYTFPDALSDEAIEMYFRPLAASPLRKKQMEEYTISLGENALEPLRENLRRWKGRARMVWGMKDTLFPVQWAEWLDRTLPGSMGVRQIAGANLFFPEEFPDVIAEEAIKLWRVSFVAGPSGAAM